MGRSAKPLFIGSNPILDSTDQYGLYLMDAKHKIKRKRMKKYIFCLVMALMTSVSMFANKDLKMVECHIVDARESLVVKNNIQRNYNLQDSELTISLKMDGDVFKFVVYEKVCEDGKTFILGKGNYNVNIICVDGNNVCIPISKERKLIINNKRLASCINRSVYDIPVSDRNIMLF